MQSVNLSRFREVAMSQSGDTDLVVKNAGKKGATLGTRSVKVSNKSSNPTKAQMAENRATRFALYNALVNAGHGKDFLAEVRTRLGLDDGPGLSRDKKVATSLKNAEVRQILEDSVADQFKVRALKEGEREAVGDFEVIDRSVGPLLENSTKDKARDVSTPQVRNQLISFICDMAEKKGVPLTRAELSPLNVADLKTAAVKLQELTKPNKQAIRDFKAEVGRLASEQMQVNSNNALDALQRLKTDKAFSSKVTFEKVDAPRPDTVAELLADLSLDFETSLHDSAGSPEARMVKTLKKHLISLQMMLIASDESKKVLMGQLTPAAFVMFNEVRNLAGILFGVEPGKLGILDGLALPVTIQKRLNEMETLLANGESVQGLTDFNTAVEKLVNEQCESLQKMMGKAFEAVVDKNKDLDFNRLLQESDPKLAELMKDMGVVEEVEERPDNSVLLKELKDEWVNTTGDLSETVQDDYKKREGQEKVAYLRTALQAYLETARENPEKHLPYAGMTKEDHKKVLDAFDKKFRKVNFLEGLPETLDITIVVFIEQTLEFDALKYDGSNKPKTDANNGPENADLKRINETSLADLAGKGALDTSQGYGKFLVGVMGRYFNSVSTVDKRSMVASLIRNSPKSIDLMSKSESEAAGAMLGAFFKGAGPMMQKTLQQLASMDMPEAFKLALADMRNNLQPLSQDVVHALLADLVEKSNGQIADIKVVKLLGAASVAQSVKCVLTDADGKTHNVVVKLIRPDAENRVKREKAIFLEEAENNGMKVSYQGKIDRIMEEFDLRIEEENAKAGAVYDKKGKVNFYKDPLHVEESQQFNDVHSVKISSHSPNQRSAMVMEEAPGITVADLLEKAKTESESIVKRHTDGPNGLKGKDKKERAVHYQTMQQELAQLYAQLEKAQQQMIHFSRHWSAEALYGSGFFHGDAHAGNLMVDLSKTGNKGLTAIDFGNATQLTATQRHNILKVIGACYIRDGKKYVEAFSSLLTAEGKAFLNAHKADVIARVNVILSKGTQTDVGEKIAATLNELQRMQIEIPPTIFNFSQCEIMIQTTIDDMNNRLEQLRSQMLQQKNMLKRDPQAANVVGEMKEPISAENIASDLTLPEPIRAFLKDGTDPDAFMSAMKEYAKDDPELLKAYDELVNNEDAKVCLNKTYAEASKRLALFNDVCEEAVKLERFDSPALKEELDNVTASRRMLMNAKLLRKLTADEERDLKAFENKLKALKLVESGEWDALYEGSFKDEAIVKNGGHTDGYVAALLKFKEALAASRQQQRKDFAELEKILDGKTDGNEHRSFVAVMGGVIMDNKATTLWELGLGTAIKFAKN